MLSRVIWIPSKAHSRLKKKNNVTLIEQNITFFVLYGCKRRARKPERLKFTVYLVLISCSCVTWDFFLRCFFSREVLQSSSPKNPIVSLLLRRPHFILQPCFSSLRICRVVIFLLKLIVSFRKSQKLQLAAHIINRLIAWLKIISVYKQFQFSFGYCNFPDNNFSCLHPPETLKLTVWVPDYLSVWSTWTTYPGYFRKADFSAARTLGFSVLLVLLSVAA